MSLEQSLDNMKSLQDKIMKLSILRNKLTSTGFKDLALVQSGETITLSSMNYSVPEQIYLLIAELVDLKICESQKEYLAIRDSLHN